MARLLLKGIEKRYTPSANSFSLMIPELSIGEGEFFALLGPSGCGKTTLLKLIAGLLGVDKGEILLNARNITSIVPERRGFGMVFQQPLLFPHMTVEENVAFGLKMQGVPKATRLQKAREMLESVGLSGLGQYVPSQLSGGQQQRVSLLRALVAQPRVLLMDEPFSALDQELRGEMRELVRQLHREHGLTILFVTHDVDEAFALADRIGVMKEGRILQVGEPLELYEHPINPAVAQCLGAKNVIYGELCGSVFRSGDFEVKVTRAKNDDVKSGWLVIRPETLQVVEAPTEDANLLQGMVKEVSFRAGIYYFKVIVNSQCLHVLHGGRSTFKPRLGQVVALTYDSKLVQFIPEHS